MGRYTFIAVALAALLGLGFWWSVEGDSSAPGAAISEGAGRAMVDVAVPEAFSPNARIGKSAFEAKCAICHGENAAGQDGVAPMMSPVTMATPRSCWQRKMGCGHIIGALETCHRSKASPMAM